MENLLKDFVDQKRVLKGAELDTSVVFYTSYGRLLHTYFHGETVGQSALGDVTTIFVFKNRAAGATTATATAVVRYCSCGRLWAERRPSRTAVLDAGDAGSKQELRAEAAPLQGVTSRDDAQPQLA